MITEKALPDDERDELLEAAASLDLPDLDAFGELLDGLDDADDELLFAVGAWWGERVRGITGWSWVTLLLGEALETPALVSADRGVAVLPLQLVAGVADGAEPPDLRGMLERLARGDRPNGPPGSYAIVA